MIQIYNQDCFVLLNSIETKSIDAIVTDPPYLISRDSGLKNGGSWNTGKNGKKKTPPILDFGEWDKVEIDLELLVSELYRVLKNSSSAIIFYDVFKLGNLKDVALACGFKQPRVGRWDKTNPVPLNSKLNYLSNASEYFLSVTKGTKPTFNSSYDNAVYRYPICHGKERTAHLTQKPLKLISNLVEKHSNKGDLILDPFMGSGTTAESCFELGRNFIGCDNDEDSFNWTKKRIDRLYI